MEVNKKIHSILHEKNLAHEIIEHEHIHTSEDAARVRGRETPKEGVKSLIFKTGEGNFILVLAPGDKRVDTKKLKEVEGTKKIALASPEEVLELAGVTVGSVGPFGLKETFKTYVDRDILDNEYSYFSTGIHTETIKMKPKDLLLAIKNPLLY